MLRRIQLVNSLIGTDEISVFTTNLCSSKQIMAILDADSSQLHS